MARIRHIARELLKAIVWVATWRERELRKHMARCMADPVFVEAAREAKVHDDREGTRRHIHRVLDRWGVPK